MKTITTKYLGATNTRGSRISASDGDGNRIVTPYRSELGETENHEGAVKALCEKMGWHGTLQGGDLLQGGVVVNMCWVWVTPDYHIIV